MSTPREPRAAALLRELDAPERERLLRALARLLREDEAEREALARLRSLK